MSAYVERIGLSVAAELADFIEREALADSGVEATAFWNGLANLYAKFTPDNRKLLATRDELQAALDTWFAERRGE